MVSAGSELVQASLDDLVDGFVAAGLPVDETETHAAEAYTLGFCVAPGSAVFGATGCQIWHAQGSSCCCASPHLELELLAKHESFIPLDSCGALSVDASYKF